MGIPKRFPRPPWDGRPGIDAARAICFSLPHGGCYEKTDFGFAAGVHGGGRCLGRGKQAALGLNIDTVFPALDKASKDTDFLFDDSAAEKSCDKFCTAKALVDTDSHLLVTYGKEDGKVTTVSFVIQMAYQDKEKVARAMLRSASAVGVLGRLVNPKISQTDLQKLQKRVGIVAEGLVQGKPGEAVYKGVKLAGAFVSGVYFLSASAK